MSEQADANTNASSCNTQNYPYSRIGLPLKDLLSRFGTKVGEEFVPLVIKWGKKGPYWKNWQTLSWDEMCSQDLCTNNGDIQVPAGQYIRLLCSGERNIGIRLGPKSGRLSNFDIDVSDRLIVDTLLNSCEELGNTLWTKGSSESGCAIWYRMSEDWPDWAMKHCHILVPGVKGRPKLNEKTGKLEENPYPLELRAQDGIQSVIYGLHSNRIDRYSVVNDFPVIELTWNKFKKIIQETVQLSSWSRWPAQDTGRRSRGEGRWTSSNLNWDYDVKKRIQILEESLGFEIIDVEEGGRSRVFVGCPNEETHTSGQNDTEATVFLDTGTYHCSHSHCSGQDETGTSFNQRQTVKIQEAFAEKESIYFRLGHARLHETYIRAYQLMAETGEFYNLNGSVHQWRTDWAKTEGINKHTLQPALNELGIPITGHPRGCKTPKHVPLEDKAESLLSQSRYINDHLTRVKFVCPCRLPYWNKQTRVSGLMNYGYNPELACLCLSQEELAPMDGKEGLAFLEDNLLKFWNFEASDGSDHSRALATTLSIAECLGGWYQDNGAYHLIEGDRRMAGKTLLIKCICAIYGIDVFLQAPDERNSINGLTERVYKSILRGDCVLAIDNIRGEFTMALLEVLATATGNVDVRLPYDKAREGYTGRMTVFLTGNEGFKFNNDMASRLCITKITYQPGARWEIDGESLLEVIKEKGALYRSAINAVLGDFARAGAPRHKFSREESKDCELRYVDWTELNNGILEFYGLPRLTLGLSKRQADAANPAISFSKRFFSMYKEGGWLGQNKNATAQTLFRILDDSTIQREDIPFKVAPSDVQNAKLLGKLFNSLPKLAEDLHEFGPGFLHVYRGASASRSNLWLISESDQKPLNPDLLEYDP